jgi:CubicO group peptidase (beta-lactamase class C family)
MAPLVLLALLLSEADPLVAAVQAGEYPRTTSVLLQRGGRTVYERYFAGTDAGTLRDVRSVGKSITGLAVGVALQEGALPSAEAPALAGLASLRPFAHDGPLKSAITIADLLTMSSALACDDDDEDSPGNEENMYPQRVWARWAVDLPVKAGYRRDAAGRGPWFYCTAGVFLLGQILQQAVGQPVDRYIEQRLFAPLGIRRLMWRRSPTGEVQTGGQLQLTTRDLARLGRLLLDRGRWQGKQVIPASWIDRSLSPHRRPNRAADPRGELHYGYLFWRRSFATTCGPSTGWFMSGNGGNHVVVFDDPDAVAVITTVNYNTRGMHDQSWRLLETHLLPRLPCASRGPS